MDDPLSRRSDESDRYPLPPGERAGANPPLRQAQGEGKGAGATDPSNPSPSPSPQGGGEGVDWLAVRQAYELTGETLVSILARFGITRSEFRKTREGEGWTARPPAIKPGPNQGKKAVGADALALRLNKLVVSAADILEKSLSVEGLNEGNARKLTEVCRAHEIMRRTEKAERAARETKKNNNARDESRELDDPSWMRAELKKRIARIRRAAGMAD